MKKIIVLLLALAVLISFSACSKEPTEGPIESITEVEQTESLDSGTESSEAEVEDFAFTHEFTQYGNGKVKIVGAEFTKDDDGEDLLRIYYDYTNTDDTANGHCLNTALNFISITQDGNECNTYGADSDDEFIIPEDLNDTNYIQPGCTNRNTILVRCDPNGGNVKVSCFLMIGGWVYNSNEVKPFDFEIDTKKLMGVPEAYVLPEITDPKYTANMSASGPLDFPLNAEVSIDGIELTKDYDERDVLRVNLTVTNNGEEALMPAQICSTELYQDGVSLPWGSLWDMNSDNITAEEEAYEEELDPGETVQCSALFYPRNQNPVEAVIESVNSELYLGARFDVKAVYDEAAAKEQENANAATAAEAEARKALVGTWLQRDSDWEDTYTFNADGSGLLVSGPEYPFTYSVSGDTLTLDYGDDDTEEFTFSVDGDLLTMIDMWEEELLLDKQTEEVSEPETSEEEPESSEEEPESSTEEETAKSLEELLVGTWVDQESGYEETFTFNEDGTGLYSWVDGGVKTELNYTYTYVDSDASVNIYYEDGGEGGFWITFDGDDKMLITNSAVTDMPLVRG